MSWNYRIIRKENNGEHIYAIHEVYYKKNGKLHLVSVAPDYPHGETVDELKEDFEHYRQALDKPVLNYEDFQDGGS